MTRELGARGRARAVVAAVTMSLGTVASLDGGLGGPSLVIAATPAASPMAAQPAVAFAGLVTQPGTLAVSELKTLHSETVSVTFESGGTPEDHSFIGVRLYDALRHIGLDVDPEPRNPLLGLYLVITANGDCQVVLSGGEIDSNFGNAPMLLAWEEDGAPLARVEEPLRLVVPGDLHGGRYIHGIVGIEVRSLVEATP